MQMFITYYPGCPRWRWLTRAGEVYLDLNGYREQNLALTTEWWLVEE